MTIAYDAFYLTIQLLLPPVPTPLTRGLTVQGPPTGLGPLHPRHGTSLPEHIQTCSYKAHAVGERTVRIQLKCLLVCIKIEFVHR